MAEIHFGKKSVKPFRFES